MINYVNTQAPLVEKRDAFSGFKKQELKKTAILDLGYIKKTTDWLVHLKKVKTPLIEFNIHHKKN
jgi:hypothetical protein